MTLTVTHRVEDELGILFLRHGLPAPRIVMQTQSALNLIMAMIHSDLLAMLPVQFTEFALAEGRLTSIPVKELLPAPPMVLVRRAAPGCR